MTRAGLDTCCSLTAPAPVDIHTLASERFRCSRCQRPRQVLACLSTPPRQLCAPKGGRLDATLWASPHSCPGIEPGSPPGRGEGVTVRHSRTPRQLCAIAGETSPRAGADLRGFPSGRVPRLQGPEPVTRAACYTTAVGWSFYQIQQPSKAATTNRLSTHALRAYLQGILA